MPGRSAGATPVLTLVKQAPGQVAYPAATLTQAADGTTFKLVAAPLEFNETPSQLTRAPDLGEHTDEVLQEVGLDMDQILDLKIKGAIL